MRIVQVVAGVYRHVIGTAIGHPLTVLAAAVLVLVAMATAEAVSAYLARRD